MRRYTAHAKARLLERGITEADVEWACNHALGDPQPGNRPGTTVLVGPFPRVGKRLKVVLDSVDARVVVTAFVVE